MFPLLKSNFLSRSSYQQFKLLNRNLCISTSAQFKRNNSGLFVNMYLLKSQTDGEQPVHKQ